MSNLVPSNDEHNKLKEYAKNAVASGLYAGIQNPHQAMMIMLTGYELNMGPVWSLMNVDIIKGKPSLRAQGMLDLVYKNVKGATIDIIQRDDQACEIVASRPESKPATFRFTMDDARRAELLGNPTWKKYPKNMLHARCVSDMCRAMFPDALAGNGYTPEEVDSFTPARDVSPQGAKITHAIVDEWHKEAPSVEREAPSVAKNNKTQEKVIIETAPEKVEPPVVEMQEEDLSSQQTEAPKQDTGLGSWTVPIGKFKGLQLDMIGNKELNGYVEHCEKKISNPTGPLKDTLEKAKQWLSGNGTNAPEMDQSEQIPW